MPNALHAALHGRGVFRLGGDMHGAETRAAPGREGINSIENQAPFCKWISIEKIMNFAPLENAIPTPGKQIICFRSQKSEKNLMDCL